VLDSLVPNPFIRYMYTMYTLSPSAYVWSDERLYVYASHDIDPPRSCGLMDRYHVFSTDGMVHRKSHGEILSSSQVPWGHKTGGFMWVPDCAYKESTTIIFIFCILEIRSRMIAGR
jgi:arabinoxylan arabinofuranohydrolase